MDDPKRPDRYRLEHFPAHREAFEARSRALTAEARWQELARLWETRVALAPDEPGAPALRYQLGMLYFEQLGDLGRARAHLRRVALAEPERVEPLDALIEVELEDEALPAAAMLLERRAARSTGPEAAGVFLKLAEVERSRGRNEAARRALAAAAEADPERAEPLRRARALAREAGDLATAAALLEQEADRFGDADLGPALLNLGRELAGEPWQHALAKRLLERARAAGEGAAAEFLAKLEEQPRRWRETARHLRAEAVEAREKRAAARLTLRAAQLHALHDPDPQGVEESLERVFLLEPGSTMGLDFLESLYEQRRDLEGLAVALAGLADRTKDRRAAARVWLRLGRLEAERLKDREAAATRLAQALEADPTLEEASARLVDILVGKGAWADAMAVLERRLAAASDPSDKAALRLALARLAHRHLDDPEAARGHYDAVLALDPWHLEAAVEVEPLHRAAGDAAGTARALEVRIEAEADVEARRRLLEQLAEVHARSGQPRPAAEALARALALAPGRERLVDQLERTAGEARAPEVLARGLVTAAETATPELRRGLLEHLAEVREHDLGDPEGAVACWRRILDEDPADPAAAAALERLVGSPGGGAEPASAEPPAGRREALDKLARQHEAAGRLVQARDAFATLAEAGSVETLLDLARVQEKLGDHAALAGTLERLIPQVEAGQRFDLELRLAAAWAGPLGRPGDAASLYARLFEEAPDRPGLVPAMEALVRQGVGADTLAPLLAPHYAAAGDWQRHLAMVTHQLATATAPAERVALLRHVASVQATHLADRRRAIEALAEALEATPEDAALVDELEALARETGAWEVVDRALSGALAQGLDRRRLSAARVLDLRVRLAELREHELGDLEGAAAVWLEVLQQAPPEDPARRRALTALAGMARESERWYDLVEALQRLADLDPGTPEAARLRLEQGEVLLRRLKQPERAAQSLRRALEEGADEATVLPRLGEALAAAGDAEGHAEVLARRIALAEQGGDPASVARLKLEHARLLSDALGDPAQALASFAAVLLDRPGDPDALAALERLLQDPELGLEAARRLAPAYERNQQYAKLAGVLERLIDAAEDGASAKELLRRLATLQERHLRRKAEALESLGRAVQLDPADVALRREYRRLADEIGALAAVVELLDQAAQRLDGAAALPLLREAAEWAETRMENPVEAIRRHQGILALDPGNLDALRALYRLHRAAGQVAELAKVSLHLADAVYDEGERRRLWREAARLREESLGDAAGAAAAWRLVLEADPSDVEAARVLDRLYQGLQDWEALAWTLEREGAQVEDGERRRELAARLATVRQRHLGDNEGALALWDGVLTSDPGHAATRESLLGLVRKGGDAGRRAAEILDRHLAAVDDHRARIGLREVQLERAEEEGWSPGDRGALLHQIRVLYEEGLGAPEMAFMVACRQLQAGVEMDAARDEAERLAGIAGTREELIEVYEEVARRLEDTDPRKLDLLRRVARLTAGAGRHAEAIDAWKRVQRLAPTDRSVLDELEKLYNQRQDATDLVDLYRQKIDLVTDPVERADNRLELARLLEQGGNRSSAADVLEAVAADAQSAPGQRRKALGLLERLYEREERHSDLARTLAALARHWEGQPERRPYLVRLGRLFEQHDARPDRALQLYGGVLAETGIPPEGADEAQAEARQAVEGLERLLARDETRQQAAEHLEPVYRAWDAARPLVDVLEVRLAVARESADRLTLLQEIADLYEVRLQQKPLAFMVWCRAFREAPTDPDVRTRLEALAGATDGWEELVGLYEEELERLEASGASADVRADFHRQLAGVLDGRLGLPAEAARHLEAAIALDPADPGLLTNLARIHRDMGDQDRLVATLSRLVEREADPARRKALLIELATTHQDQRGDKAAAVEAWNQVLEVAEPDQVPEVLGTLGRLLEQLGRWPSLLGVYERQRALAEAAGDPEAVADWNVRIGKVRETRLDAPLAAVEDYRAALASDPGQAEALAALEAFLGAEGETDTAVAAASAEVLAPLYEARGDDRGRIRALERMAETADPERRAQLLAEVAQLHAGDADNLELAFLAASKALEANPERLDLLDRLDALADQGELEEEEAGILENILPSVRTDETRARVRRRLGAILSDAGEVEEAVPHYRALLELVPGDLEALDRLARLLRLQGDHAGLVEVLAQRAELARDEQERVRLLGQIAALQETELQVPEAALATWRRLHEARPADREILARMDALCQRLERWRELQDVLRREAQASADAQDRSGQADFLHRLAVLEDERLQDAEAATALFREVLELAPGHPGTVTYLEALLEARPGRHDVARLLEGVYRAQAQWGRLLTVLDLRAGHEVDREARAEVLVEMAAIQERRMGAPEMAFVILCRALNERPDAPAILQELERLAEATGQFDELAAVVEDALDEVHVPEAAAELHLVVGRIQEERLGDFEGALAHLEAALEVTPDRSDALRALDRLYRRLERHEALAQVLEALAARTDDPDEKVGYLFRLGQLLKDQLERPEAAVAAFQRVLELAPAHRPALRALGPIYEGLEAWDALARNLEARLELATDDAERSRLAARLASVQGEQLGDLEAATARWTEVLALDPRSEAAFDALEDLYSRGGAWEPLAALLERRLALAVDPREQGRLQQRLAAVLGDRLSRTDEAVAGWRRVLERDPRNRQALESLLALYERAEDWEAAVGILKRLVSLQEDAAGLQRVRTHLAELLGRRLGRRDEAVDAARRALEVEPHDPERLAALEDLFRTLEAPQEALRVTALRERILAESVDTTRRVLAHAEDEEREALEARLEALASERVPLLRTIAEGWREIGRAEGGAEALESLLAIEPGDAEAFEALRGLYESSERWRELTALLERRLELTRDPDARRALQLEVARLHESRLGQKPMAFLALGRAFEERPDDRELEDALFRVARESGSEEELAAILEEVTDAQPAGDARTHLLIRLSNLQDEVLDDAEAAEASLRRILADEPAHPEALDRLAALFEGRGEATRLVVALEQKLLAAASPEAERDLLVRIAELQTTTLHNPEEAEATWQRVLELDGSDAQAFDALIALQEGGEAWESLARTLGRAAEASSDPARTVSLLHRQGLVREERLGDDAGAIAAWQAALAADPRDPAVVDDLERVLTRLQRWSELLQMYEGQIGLAEDPEARVRLWLKVAALQENEFDQPAEAVAAYDHVLEVDAVHLGSIRALERLLRRLQDFKRLIAILEHHAGLAQDPTERVALLVEQGQVWHEALSRVDRAEALFRNALETDPESRHALGALAHLYERSGNWADALEMLERQARLLGAAPEAVALWLRMGRIEEDMLLDVPAARRRYEQVLELDPGNTEALQAVARIAEAQQDWRGYLDALVQEAEHTSDLALKTRLLVRIGKFHRDHREDPEAAVKWFESALERTEDDLEAAEAAASLHLEAERWERAEQLLVIVCAGHEAAGLEPKALARWWYKLGWVRQKLERTEAALEAFRRAYDSDATWLPVLEGLGAALVASERWEEALKVYQTILIHHRDSVTDLEVVEYYWQLGDLNRRLEQPDRAIKNFEKALEIEPAHEASLGAVIHLLEAREAWDEAVEYRHRLLETLQGEDRYEMLLSIGQLARERSEDAYQAIDAYVAAHRLAPDRIGPLASLQLLYEETHQWARLAEVLQRLIAHPEVVQDTARARRLTLKLASVLREELKDVDQATAVLDRALDADYAFVKAFAAQEEMLAAQRRYGELEAAYVRMIQRIPKTPDTHAVRIGLWRTLGDLYRTVLRNREGAIAAYQVVTKADPRDVEALTRLAELQAEGPEGAGEAAAALRRAVQVSPQPAPLARRLLTLATGAKDYEQAFVVSSVITWLLGEANAEERQIAERLAPYQAKAPVGAISGRLFAEQVAHPDLGRPVGRILAAVWEYAMPLMAQEPKSLGVVPRRDAVDVASSMLFFANLYRQVAGWMGAEGVPLYKRADHGAPLAPMPTWPVSLVASEEMLGRGQKRQLTFAIGRALAFTRPELAAGRLFEAERLDQLLQAAVLSAGIQTPPRGDAREIQRLARGLERALPAATRAEVRAAAGAWRPDASLAEVRAYGVAAELTADRVATLLTGDLSVVRGALAEDPGGPNHPSQSARVAALARYCLSDAWLAARSALGLTLKIPG